MFDEAAITASQGEARPTGEQLIENAANRLFPQRTVVQNLWDKGVETYMSARSKTAPLENAYEWLAYRVNYYTNFGADRLPGLTTRPGVVRLPGVRRLTYPEYQEQENMVASGPDPAVKHGGLGTSLIPPEAGAKEIKQYWQEAKAGHGRAMQVQINKLDQDREAGRKEISHLHEQLQAAGLPDIAEKDLVAAYRYEEYRRKVQDFETERPKRDEAKARGVAPDRYLTTRDSLEAQRKAEQQSLAEWRDYYINHPGLVGVSDGRRVSIEMVVDKILEPKRESQK